MTSGSVGTILGHIRRAVCADAAKALTDAELLVRYATERDESAFATLLQRHGRLVWRVCRRQSPTEHDAEDAFQATFLVLARRATSIRKATSLTSWLYGVAHRISVTAGRRARARRQREQSVGVRTVVEPVSEASWRELQRILDDEVQRLPERYRGPFVACCLEGHSREEFSRETGLAAGTISSRVARARRLLQRRLTRRGVSLSAVLCAFTLRADVAAEALPAGLTAKTQRAVVVPHRLSPAVRALVESTLSATWSTHRVALTTMMATFGLVVIGVTALSSGMSAAPEPSAAAQNSEPRQERLPVGAIARLGRPELRAPGSDLAISADGTEIVAVGPELTVRRFDANTGELRSLRQLPRRRANRVWLSPRGTFLATIGYGDGADNKLEIWDLAGGKLARSLSLGRIPASDVAFSADERRVAVAATNWQEHRVNVFELQTGNEHTLWSGRSRVDRMYYEPWVAWSPDGKRLVSGQLDLTMRCWDPATDELRWQTENNVFAHFALFSPDGQVIVAGGEFRDADTGRVLKRRKPPRDCRAPVAFSPDGRYLAFQTGEDGTVLWEPEAAAVAARLPALHPGANQIPGDRLQNLAFTPDSKAVVRRYATLERWDVTTGKVVFAGNSANGHTEDVSRVLFSPDGKLLVSGAHDGTARVWDVATRRAVRTLPKTMTDHLALAPGGRRLLVASPELGKVALQMLEVDTGQPVRKYIVPDSNEFVRCSTDGELRISADGKKLLALSTKNGGRGVDCMFWAWDAADGRLLTHKRVPWAADGLILPDGTAVLGVSDNGLLCVFDIESEKPRFGFAGAQPIGPPQYVRGYDVVLSPDERLVLARRKSWKANSGEVDEPAWLGEMSSGRRLLQLAPGGPVSFAFSADSALFAICDHDAIHLWECATRKEIGSLKTAETCPVPTDRPQANTIAFSPDGRTLASGHADGTVLLWDASLRNGARGERLSTERAAVLWTDLASENPVRAYSAIWQLVDDPDTALSLFTHSLRPEPPIDNETIRALLRDLENNEFARREAAEQKLRSLGERAELPLRTALAAGLSAERKGRVEAVLDAIDSSAVPSGDRLRELRSVMVLERIHSADARQTLLRLADQTSSARVKRAATEALRRMDKR
jgi:RNA polymerase sigma factor (sigma-70 family)